MQFMPVWMKSCQLKEADLLFSATLALTVLEIEIESGLISIEGHMQK